MAQTFRIVQLHSSMALGEDSESFVPGKFYLTCNNYKRISNSYFLSQTVPLSVLDQLLSIATDVANRNDRLLAPVDPFTLKAS